MSGIDVKNILVEAACDAQRSNGVEPTPSENEKIFVTELEKGDNRARHRNSTSSEKSSSDLNREYKRRSEKMGYNSSGEISIERRSVKTRKTARRNLNNAQKRIIAEKWLLKKRLNELKSAPEWRVLVHEAIGNILGAISPLDQALAQRRLSELIDRSNKSFGDWRKVPSEILFFGGGK